MMKDRCILLIDDKDQEDVSNSIKTQLRNDFDLEFLLIRTAAPELKEDNSEDLDLSKLKAVIEDKIGRKHIDVALTRFVRGCHLQVDGNCFGGRRIFS